ncbi:multicopper oxidase MmcO [Kribbella sancticallisti]|uniref:Multicopper oxidase MmcO n=1 Tax=Kribbella sancticallisti TaxID=460087 RepID=A0ABN2DNI3_9ACTN
MKTEINRRSVLLGGAGVLAGCSTTGGSTTSSSTSLVGPSDPAVRRVESSRRGTGREQRVSLTAVAARQDLGAGLRAATWTFDGRTAGTPVRMRAGDTLVAAVSNRLPGGSSTSIHWHGVALRNDMDGVAGVTQAAVPSGGDFTYRFIAPDPGTYFFHPHVGVQLDRGLYAPLIVEDPKEPLAYGAEWVVLLDDWIDGVNGTPDDVFAEVRQGMAGSSTKYMLMGATSKLLGGDAGDVSYPYHLVNGGVAADPDVFTAKPGERVRLRMINAGSDTAYRVALSGHRLTITHTDGFPVEPVQVDTVLIGMGERYDVLVTLGDGIFPLVALAEGKDQTGMALVRSGSGRRPATTFRPPELAGSVLQAGLMKAAEQVRLTQAQPDVTHQLKLTGGMDKYDWSVDGQRFDMENPTASPLLIREGQRVRLDFVNETEMWHPMHLHGHTFQIGEAGPRKDTAIVLPRKTLSVVFDADNPGQWLLHCHNTYHGEAGMMALVAYQA